MVPEEYLTVKEVATRLKLSPKTVKNKMTAGVFRRGVHYFAPPGMGPRFKWSAVVTWIEQAGGQREANTRDRIPMARGYFLGKGS